MFITKVLATTIDIKDTIAATTDFSVVISTLLDFMFIVSGLAMLVFLVMGGVQFITSGGDKVQAQAARDRITYALIGILVVAASFAIVAVLENVLGITILGQIILPSFSGDAP